MDWKLVKEQEAADKTKLTIFTMKENEQWVPLKVLVGS